MKGNRTNITTSIMLFSSLMFSLNNQALGQGGFSNSIQDIIGFTGILTFILFALATLILPLRFLHRFVRRITGKDTPIRKTFRFFRPIYKGLHLVVGVGALGLITYHAFLSFEVWNIFLVLGLMMVWANILPGLFYYSKFFNQSLSKKLYRIHVSIVYRILIIVFLYSGHMFAV